MTRAEQIRILKLEIRVAMRATESHRLNTDEDNRADAHDANGRSLAENGSDGKANVASESLAMAKGVASGMVLPILT